MNFQLPATTAASAGGFSFGAPNTTAAGQATAPKPASGFSFGATGVGGGGDASSGPKPLGFGFGANTAAAPAGQTATPSLGLGGGGGIGGGMTGFGAPAANTMSATITASTPAAAPAPTGFGAFAPPPQQAPAAAATTTAPINAPQPAAPAALSTGFSFAAPTASAPKQAAAAPTQITATAPAPVPTATAAPAPAKAPATGGFASLTTATKTTDSAVATNASQLSYNQLEEHINKWTLELEEQEKVFTDQATQINAWDKILICNNQKILDLNDAVQKVKSDQQTLEQELEFIATQHKELEESIVPLQKEFLKIPQVDVERSQTYLMVENLDTQLKQMSEDLKEIIDNLNESNKNQDNTDPIIQIGKILNAHMSSLQWIEQSTSNIGNKLEDITKMHETFKRDSERSFRSAYYN